MMQQPMPMGPPMGGMMGPPMGQPAPMPMGPTPGPMPMQPQGDRGSQVSGYGGSARGRAGFKQYLQSRKSMYPTASMRPLPALPPPPVPQVGMMGGSMVGRQLPSNQMVGSAPVQMMVGGVVPLFRGLGRY